jgi:acyl carrier protein
MNSEEIERMVEDVVRPYLLRGHTYTHDATFTTLRCDSMDIISIFAEVEEELGFDIDVEDHELPSIDSPRALMRYIEVEVNGK